MTPVQYKLSSLLLKIELMKERNEIKALLNTQETITCTAG